MHEKHQTKHTESVLLHLLEMVSITECVLETERRMIRTLEVNETLCNTTIAVFSHSSIRKYLDRHVLAH